MISEARIREEFDRSTEKFHVIATWVGSALNLLWFISDYFILPEYLGPFFLFRLVVSSLGIGLAAFRKKAGISIYTCMFVLVAGISVQNAYMWSVMDLSHFQKHAFAYMVLFIGAGMLVLWEFKLSILLIVLTIAANIFFYWRNSQLSPEDFLINGGLLILTVVIFCVFMIRSRYRLTYNEIRSRLQLEQSKKMIEQKHEEVLAQKVEIQNQKDALQLKNREITDSINYARSIQSALIPGEEKLVSLFEDGFVLFSPKDIVSGDFYWAYEKTGSVFYVTADCTGHGVPGGFMTMLGLSFLDEIIIGQNITDPAEVLELMRDKIINTLNRSGGTAENKDGMDIVVCHFQKQTMQLTFAAANNNLYLVKESGGKKKFEVFKADRQPCGFGFVHKPFSSHSIQLKPGDCIYTFTDGFADQFGGPEGKKFRYKQFEQLLLQNSHLPFLKQKQILQQNLQQWRGSLDQVDDVLVIGLKV